MRRRSRHDHPRRSGAGEPRMGRPAGAQPAALPAGARAAPAAPARGSRKREDKDSLTVGSRTALRRLARRGEDKDSPEFLIFPHSSTRRRGGMSRIGKIRKGPFLILPICTTPPADPAAPAAAAREVHGCGRRRAPCPPSLRSSIRRLNAQPDGRGWSCPRNPTRVPARAPARARSRPHAAAPDGARPSSSRRHGLHWAHRGRGPRAAAALGKKSLGGSTWSRSACDSSCCW